jgi:hypothetical protein
MPQLEELEELNVREYLVARINSARFVNQEDPKPHEELARRSYSELTVLLRHEEEGGQTHLYCSTHTHNKGEFLDIDSLKVKCQLCIRSREERAYPVQSPDSIEAFRSALDDRIRELDSFCIPPLLLSSVTSLDLGRMLKLASKLRDDLFYIPYCPLCLKKLDRTTTLQYPCEKSHLVCTKCNPRSKRTVCIYDRQEYRNDHLQLVGLELVAIGRLSCPVCTLIVKLKELPCGHAFCSPCIDRLRQCPMCKASLAFVDVSALQLDSCMRIQLPCVAGDGNATLMSLQTCELFCRVCADSHAVRHSYEDVPESLPEFLKSKIFSIIGQLLGLHSPAYDAIDESCRAISFDQSMQALRNYLHHFPHASLELRSLLAAHHPSSHPQPVVSSRLNENSDYVAMLAKLLFCLKTDLTNCDLEKLKQPVGWRLPQLSVQEEYSVAMRFTDVLPPQFSDPTDRGPNRGPLLVDLGQNQIELVSLTPMVSVDLFGIVMATTAVFCPTAALELFEVYQGVIFQDIGASAVYTKQSAKLFSHRRQVLLNGPETQKAVLFDFPFRLNEGTLYLLKFKLGGSREFYRGNPFTLSEVGNVFCADGSCFCFTSALCFTKEYVNSTAKHQISSSLLGLIYRKV